MFAVALLAGLTVLAPSASAAEDNEGSAPATRGQVLLANDAESGDAVIQALAPPCVHRWYEEHWYAFHVHGQNNCGYRLYVKVIIAFGFDSACMGLNHGQSFTHSFQWGRFDRLELC